MANRRADQSAPNSDSNAQRLKLLDLFKQSLIAKVVVAVLLVTVLSSTSSFWINWNNQKSILIERFSEASTKKTTLLAINASGAIRWKKTQQVAEAYEDFAKEKNSDLVAVLAYTANREKVAEHNPDAIAKLGLVDYAQELLAPALKETVVKDLGEHLLVVSPTSRNKNGEPYGVLAIAWSKAQINKTLDASLVDMIFGFTIMAIVLIGTLVFLLSVQVTRPLAAVSAVIRDIANGEIDGEIPHTGRMDEVGRISQSLMVLKRNEGERRRLARESEEETSQRQIRQQATEALISEFRVAISQSLEELNSTMTQMNCASEELGEIAENTSKGVLVVSKASEEANVGFQTIAGTTEEISMSVNEIFGLMGETQQVVSSAVTNVEQANDKVIKLTSAAEKIGNVVSLIMEIAEQTNLLALNATIEAARAGEAGKGFAVVASEVKALAIQTAKATEEISSQIETIQSSTEDSVRAIQSISETLDKVNEYTSSVSAAIEEQGTAMTEISRSTGESAQNSSIVSRNIENVSDSASKTRDSAQLVRDASVRLNSQSSRMSETIDAFLKAVAAA